MNEKFPAMQVFAPEGKISVNEINQRLKPLAFRGRQVEPAFPRREMLKWMSACGALLTTGCDSEEPDPDPVAADGSFSNPYTRDDPGEKPDVHLPVLYAGNVSDSSTRLWVEIFDPGTGIVHDMNQEHYIKQIAIFDNYGNEIAGQGFYYDMQARLITQIEIPKEAEQIYVYTECNKHGWWLTVYNSSDLAVDPAGDQRRPYTKDKPGDWTDLVKKHVPIFGRRPDGTFSVEVGDRVDGELHVMTDQHYMSWILIYDEFAQLRAYVELSPSINPEPVYDFTAIGGTKYLRMTAYCNLHGWWEEVYSMSDTESSE